MKQLRQITCIKHETLMNEVTLSKIYEIYNPHMRKYCIE